MRKVEEIGRFSIYVEERPSRDTYYLRYWDSVRQKQVARKLGGHSLAEVRGEALDLIRPMISADDVVESADPLFSQVWIVYQNHQRAKISKARHHLNELRWPLYYQPHLGSVRCSKMTAALNRMSAELLKIGTTKGDVRQKLSPNTVYDIVSTARAAVEHARSTGVAAVPQVPVIEVPGMIAPRDGRIPKGRLVTLAEIGSLIDAAATDKAGEPSLYPHVLHQLLIHIGSGARSGAVFELTEPQVLTSLGVFDLRRYHATEDRSKPRGIVPISGPLWWVFDNARETIGRDGCVVHYRGEGLRGKNATQIISRIRERARLNGKTLNLDRLNNYSFRHTLANWLRDYVPEGYISALLGHSVMVTVNDRWRMHETAATVTKQNYFDSHPESREVARHRRMLANLYAIRDAMDEHFWPEVQKHCQFDLRLGQDGRSTTEADSPIKLVK